jgi:uncharacterized protein (TIGR01777 family)
VTATPPRRGEQLRIAVAGASGFIGSALVPLLESQGHEVIAIGRARRGHGRQPIRPSVVWDPARGELDPETLRGIDGAINLAGANIGQRWSEGVKREIRESRVRSTELLAGTMARLSPAPRVLVNMSAVGFYGDRGDEVLDERSTAGKGFLSEVVRAWEAATKAATDAGIRVVCARHGVVIHPSDSMLARLLPIFRMGVGGTIGNGQQWLSWVSRTDSLRALLYLLGDHSLGGVVNVTSPEPVRNAELTRVLGRVLKRPALVAVPGFAVRLLYGEMGEETVLAGQRVLPRRLGDAGFQFQFPLLEPALRHELSAG